MWRTCPHAKAVPGVRVAYTDEREIQHALDAGALVDRRADGRHRRQEAIEARNWTYFPPLGRRSNGGGQAFDATMWGGVPGGYRNTINDNVVLILMIETLEGPEGRRRDREGARRDRGVRGERRPRQLLRLPAGHARLRARDQHRPRRARSRRASGCAGRLRGAIVPTSRCFQAGSETAAIARGVAAELGETAAGTEHTTVPVGPICRPPKPYRSVRT